MGVYTGSLGFVKSVLKELTRKELWHDEELVMPGLVMKKIPVELDEKLKWLQNGEGVGKHFIEEMIREVNTVEGMKTIVKYLTQHGSNFMKANDLEPLYREAMKKLIHITNDMEMIQKFINKSFGLVEGLVNWIC